MTKAATDTPNGVPQMQPPSPQTVSTEGFAKCAHQTIETTNSKRIIACCDGTWNNSNKGTTPTNVGRLSSAIAHKCCTGMPQIVYYTRGAGTDESSIAGKYLGGIFGKGVKQEIRDTYRFICDNYNPGDEIIILGFSRGAFTARSVSGFVCTIGLLNRLGLSRFADIFDDYQDFAKWKSGQFNKEKHLKAFTLSNFKRLEQSDPKSALKGCSDEKLEKVLDEKKKTIYDDMVKCRGTAQERLRKMARVYKKALEKHRMILCEKNKDEEWVPIDGKVKAVGVWDTVGSLGFPKMPSEFIPWNRNAEELRFASLDVHPNVDHAFHALALDEWRTAFKPTLWGMKGNKHTELRQVWFPGGHSNVGGGFPDQQIATISMAWMADRLTSIGVEFSTPEMKRLCYTLQPGVKPRPWGLGKISDPDNRLITIPDRAINAFWYPIKKYDGENTKVGGRTPGKYMEDDGKKPIEKTEEYIHPSARIRYLYKGLGLNDEGNWDCAALTKNGYTLEKIDAPHPDKDLYPKSRIASTYETLSGTVSSVNRSLQSDIQSDNDHPLVVQEMPFKEELWPIPEKSKSHWVWTQGIGEDKKTLPEERIGMWERLFISINEEMVKREKEEEAAKEAASSGQSKEPGLVRRMYDKVYNTVNDRWQSAKGRVGKMFGRTIAGRMFNRTLGKVLRPSEKPMPSDYPKTYGYQDMISWQRGDPTTKPQSSGKLNQELERY